MQNRLETQARRLLKFAENLTGPKPVEITVPSATWEHIDNLYKFGCSLPDNEKPGRAAEIYRLLRESGLNIYYEIFLGHEKSQLHEKAEPYFRVNAAYEASESERRVDGTPVHVFTFSRVTTQKTKH